MTRNRLISILLAGTAISVSHARADIVSWANPVNGKWRFGTSWDAGFVPSINDQVIIGFNTPYTVTVQSDAFAQSLSITNPLATMEIEPVRLLDIADSLHNDGIIRILVRNASLGGTIRFVNDAVLTGSGQIILDAQGFRSQIATIQEQTLTQGPMHSIVGRGRISAKIINNGSIRAQSSADIINFINKDLVNNNEMLAANAGTLNFTEITITQAPDAEIVARGIGSQIVLTGVSVVGGRLAAEQGATISLRSMAIVNRRRAELTDVTLEGDIVFGQDTTWLHNTITNNASVTVINDLRYTGDVILQGTGELILSNFITEVLGGDSSGALTNMPGHTIRGAGSIQGYTGRFVNNGSCVADIDSDELAVQFAENNANLSAINGSTLILQNLIQGDGGFFEAGDGSRVELLNGMISGGTFRTTGTGQVSTSLEQHADGVHMSNIQFDCVLNLPSLSQSLYCDGIIVNNGQILMSPDDVDGFAQLYGSTNGALEGTGVVKMLTRNAYIGAGSLINGDQHTIEGMGSINLSLVNNGMIKSNFPNETLAFTGSSRKTNNKVIESINGATLRFDHTRVLQSSAGVIRAVGDQSTLEYVFTELEGGQIDIPQSSPMPISEFSSLTDVKLNGPTTILSGTHLKLFHDVVNNGLMIVNPDDPNALNPTALEFQIETPTLSGTGTILLASPGVGSEITSVLPDDQTIIGPNLRIEGVGALNTTIQMQGTLAPGIGSIVNDLSASKPIDLAPQATLEIELDLNSNDRLVSTSSVDLGGTLKVTYANGYLPSQAWSRTIMTADSITGTFDRILIPFTPIGYLTVLQVTNTEVSIGQFCQADLNLDFTLDFFDISAFISAFSNQDPAMDFNSDGHFNFFDISIFLTKFASGCR